MNLIQSKKHYQIIEQRTCLMIFSYTLDLKRKSPYINAYLRNSICYKLD
ncbi:hypothetical protein J2Z52_003369 [Enterococcus rivorum]|nr:hypothetical protein [Enterococcus rivorum]